MVGLILGQLLINLSFELTFNFFTVLITCNCYFIICCSNYINMSLYHHYLSYASHLDYRILLSQQLCIKNPNAAPWSARMQMFERVCRSINDEIGKQLDHNNLFTSHYWNWNLPRPTMASCDADCGDNF